LLEVAVSTGGEEAIRQGIPFRPCGLDPSIYNIVDNEPAPVSEWIPALAEALGANHLSTFPSGSLDHCSASTAWP
jgi:hypothetical protein